MPQKTVKQTSMVEERQEGGQEKFLEDAEIRSGLEGWMAFCRPKWSRMEAWGSSRMPWVFVICGHPDPFTLRFGNSSWLSFGCPPLMPFTGSGWADALEVAGDQAWPVGLKSKEEKREHRHFTKEESAMANTDMIICLTLLVIREREIEVSEKLELPCICQKGKTLKDNNSKCWRICETIGTFILC